MPISISKIEGEKRVKVDTLAKNKWELLAQFNVFEEWVKNEAKNLESGKWIADIGFSPRSDACGGGPIISPEVMQACIDIGLSIYLSEYCD